MLDSPQMTRGRQPQLPPGVRIYAIGDIHGRVDLLDQMIAQIEHDKEVHPSPRALCVFLGDYIDRGPWSRATVDRLIAHSHRHETIFLSGNHEQVALQSLSEAATFIQWLRLGGLETLTSYGVPVESLAGPSLSRLSNQQVAVLQHAFYEAMPQTHLKFFQNLKSSFTCGDFFFVHAGVNPNIDIERQNERDLFWIREEFLRFSGDFGKIVVHGHTPVREAEIWPNRINIDTGAYATGCLTCLIVEAGQLSTLATA